MFRPNTSVHPLAGRRVVVTGGAGMIGSCLVERLLGLGADVTVIDSLWRGRREHLERSGRSLIDLASRFHQIDLAEPTPALPRLLEGADTVFHLADVVAGIGYVFGKQFSLFTTNTAIDSATLRAAIAARVPNYIYVGSACSYPKEKQSIENPPPLREHEVYPASPESAYGWSKLMGEYILERAQAEGLIRGAVLRLHNVYGPRTDLDPARSQVIPALIRKALLAPAEPFVVWGSGRQRRAFVFVEDVAQALLRLRERGMGQSPVQFGNPSSTSIADLARTIARLTGRDLEPRFDTTKPEGDFDRIPELSRCREVLGMEPTTTLEQGLTQTIQWARSVLLPESERAAA